MGGRHRAQAISLGHDRVTVDPGPVGALIEAHLDRAFRLATVILGSAMEAEDAVADSALAAWRARGRLRETDRFEAWFGRILINVCRDRLRARRRHPVGQLAASGFLESRPDGVADFRDAVDARDALSRAFETLQPDERIVLVLRFWRDLTVETIADQLGIPAGTVRSRLHHATGRLRSALAAMETDR